MAKTFDFNKFKPKTMIVTLFDEKKTVLAITTPNKKLKDELTYLNDMIADADEDEALDTLYEVASKVMSRNTQNIKFTSEQLKEWYPDENYMVAFLEAYGEFVSELTNVKN